MDECEHDVPAGGYFSPKLYLQRYLFIGLFLYQRKISDMNLSNKSLKKQIRKVFWIWVAGREAF